jgi:hypothetical protein
MSRAGSSIHQKAYLIERADQIATFAKAHHARLGRGIVVINWPLPEDLKAGAIVDYSNYLPEEMMKLVGLDTTEELVRAVRRYDPMEQAIVLCVESPNHSFSVHVLTAIYEYTGPVSLTDH